MNAALPEHTSSSSSWSMRTVSVCSAGTAHTTSRMLASSDDDADDSAVRRAGTTANVLRRSSSAPITVPVRQGLSLYTR